MHMMGRTVSGFIVLAGLAACSYSGETQECCGDPQIQVARSDAARVPASEVATADLQSAAAANNAFALALYGQIISRPAGVNLLTSPLSASLALTMAYAGAAAETKAQMAAALQIAPEAEGAIFAGQNALSQLLSSRADTALQDVRANAALTNGPKPDENDYHLSLVSSAWGEQTYTWEKPFLDILASSYGTGVLRQDFMHGSEQARLTIDDWVSAQTNDRLNGLFGQDDLNANTRLVLVNALYFRLPWELPFILDSQQDYFQAGSGNSVLANFMHRTDELAYADDGQAQVVRLPLASQQLALLIALPHAGVTLADYESAVTQGRIALAVPENSAPVQLTLPKVAFTTPTLALDEPLRALGMRDAFDPAAADFSALCAHPADGANLFLTTVVQKATLTLDEHGVEAAAASGVVFGRHAASTDPPIEVDVKRPFLLALIDQPTGAIVMLGHVTDPNDRGGP